MNSDCERPCHEEAQQVDRQDKEGLSRQLFLGIAFVTFNSAIGIYRSLDEPSTVAFVTIGYVDIVLLFLCVSKIERSPQGSPERGRLRFAVLFLSTLITVLFSYRVASEMPAAAAVAVWSMAALSILVGLGVFFVFRDDSELVAGKVGIQS